MSDAGREAVLATDAIHRSFGGVRAVENVSVRIEAGRITGLIGPNGAGKSTLLALLAGSLAPSLGSIRFAGQDVTHLPLHRRAELGLVLVPQRSSEFPRLTVLENLLTSTVRERGDSLWGALLSQRFWGGAEAQVVEDAEVLLESFHMSHMTDEYAGELSGGQKRLLAIMRGLMMRPRVLLLDEPFAGINPTLAREISSYLTALRDHSLTVVMVEHEMEAVDRLCDVVYVMAQGSILAHGTMSDLRRHPEVVEAYLVG
jgi:ABC-type branched-subunit amino acid transport system ATPase component